MRTFASSRVRVLATLLAASGLAGVALLAHVRSASAAEASASDKFAQVRGWQVRFTGGNDALSAVPNQAFAIEAIDVGSDRGRPNGAGHKAIGEVTLRGAVTDAAGLGLWAAATLSGLEKKNVVHRDLSARAIAPTAPELEKALAVELRDCELRSIELPRGTQELSVTLECETDGRDYQAISNVSRSRHETAKNSISNVR